ncbi:hypothetical protein MWN41_04070, partial [Ornithobacterium rhinotracheale]|uniref:hypothetical protein n=1 Tax=Ornithobacterium rhinotracheale TaxID=28251 RepID=UPI001FF3F6D7
GENKLIDKMNNNISIAQQYYKVQKYWEQAISNKNWKLAIWVAQYPDVEIISQFMDMESTVLGETEEIGFKFHSVFTETEEYEKSLWNEFSDWFNLNNDEKYDMHKALIKDGFLKEPFVPNTNLKPTIQNLINEFERFTKSLIDVSANYIIEFALGMHHEGYNFWLDKLLKCNIPKNIRFVTIDLAQERKYNKFSKKTYSKVYEIHPKLEMVDAIKNEMSKDTKGKTPHAPDSLYKLAILELMEALPNEKKMKKLINKLLSEAHKLQDISVLASSYLIIAHAYNSIKKPKEGLKQIELALQETEKLKQSKEWYPLWRSCMLFKAAFLIGLKKEKEAFEIYEEIAQQATTERDYFYIMESYRVCASIRMKEQKYSEAFEYASLALYGGSFLDITTRQNSTFLYAANLAFNTVDYVKDEKEKRIILCEHLKKWLGSNWVELISIEENLNSHYAPLAKEEEIIEDQL